MKVTKGCIVNFSLSESSVSYITDIYENQVRLHRGNPVFVGELIPALVVKVNDDGSVNLRAYTDGTLTLWVPEVHEGDEPGTWSWPEREILA